MKLVEIMGSIKILKSVTDLDIEIKDIKYNSQNVEKGDIFVDINRNYTYINEAIKKGAQCIVCDIIHDTAIPFILVEDSRKALALMSKNYFGRPDERLVITGVTGTNGKTSVSTFLRHILGEKAGLIGTNGNFIKNKIYTAKNTTPQSYEVYRLLKEMADSGCTHCVMEVSSHGLALDRVYGISFDAAVFTNLTGDHIDFHGSFENYKNAKTMLARASQINIVNADDDNFSHIENAVKYSIKDKNTDFYGENIRFSHNSTSYDIVVKGERYAVKISSVGIFTVYNSLAAIASAVMLGIDIDEAVKRLENAKTPLGRCEYVPTDNPFDIMIDFAHTPDGMEKVLSMMKSIAKGKVITVFGCGGDRDKGKRPLMGSIAAKYSDKIIITSDNPRSEKPLGIICDIMEGIRESDADACVIPDRKDAIFYAMKMAEKDDIVLLLGKGHEKYIEKNGIKTYFDERDVVAHYK